MALMTDEMIQVLKKDQYYHRKLYGSDVIIMSATIFLAILAYSSLLPLSSSYYGNPFYTFTQTTRSTDLSLSNLIKQNAPYQRRISSAAVTIINFSDLQCHLCNRFVKATEPQINSTYVQTGKIALVFEHLPNR